MADWLRSAAQTAGLCAFALAWALLVECILPGPSW